MSRKLAVPSAAIAFVIASAILCVAQVEQGSITGLVTDQSGAAVPGARVTVTNLNTQVTASTETNNQGIYTFPFLSHGEYAITAEKQGFSLERVTSISLRVGLTATINLTLKPGTIQQEITVTANAVLLEQQSSSQGNVVSSQQ